MIPPIVADTGGLLRALARTSDGQPTFPEYENVLTSASLVIVPGTWFPRLLKASPRQRTRWELIGGGIGIHWEAVDEDISVASLLQPENFMRLPDEALQPTSRVERRRRKATGSGASRG